MRVNCAAYNESDPMSKGNEQAGYTASDVRGQYEAARIYSLDAMRVFAAFAVICIHTQPFSSGEVGYSNFILQHIGSFIHSLCKFAVPFFFMSSGYFFGLAILKGNSLNEYLGRYLKRIALILLSWSLFYIFLPPNLVKVILQYGLFEGYARAFYWDSVLFIVQEPLKLLQQGTVVHLWFLISLILIYCLFYPFVRFKKTGLFFYVAVLLYGFGLLGGAYSKTAIGIETIFNVRNGPFYGAIFVVLGFYLSRFKSFSVPVAWGFVTVGVVGQLLEDYVLSARTGFNGLYNFTTPIYVTGIFLLALAHPKCWKFEPVQKLASLTLGIYVSHLFFVNLFLPFKPFVPILYWDLVFSFLVFGLSSGAVILIKKTSLSKWLIT